MLNAQQLSRLQLAIEDWIVRDGGQFGKSLERREVATAKSVLTVSEVAIRMTEAAAACYKWLHGPAMIPANARSSWAGR